MNELYRLFEEKVLKHCQKPARYIGNEINAIKKDWQKIKVKWGLLFPDLYELGSSNLGLTILYSILNERSDTVAERFFMPAKDAIALMEKWSLPPLSLESKRPPYDFDIIGITLPYELTVTNILKFLEMASIPYKSSERRGFPIVIGGGALAYNPLPLLPFFDAFVIGDGEDAVNEITEIIKENKKDRWKALFALSKLPYIFVPGITKREEKTVKRAIVSDLNRVSAGRPLLPLIDTTFNRLSIECARGCTRGCRFCFAGMTQRPYRERDIEKLANLFISGLVYTGFDEISPSSLSITDFSDFPTLFHCLSSIADTFKASLSLPSMRVGSIKDDVAEKISSFRKTGFTVAPETYPSLQTSLNKNIDYDALKKDILTAFKNGWLNIKLYYMLGLPKEEKEGFYEIKEFVKAILRESNNKANITLSFSTFVPKPHTPLQWCNMISLEEIEDRHKFLKSLFFKEKKIYLRLHNPHMSILEGIIARGTEKIAELIERAYKKGALFDAWDEHINFNYWTFACNELGLDLKDLLKGYDLTSPLPWDFIDTGITKSFLLSEYEKYMKGIPTPDCRYDKCSNCGVCDFKMLKPIFTEKGHPIELLSQSAQSELKRYLLVYEKVDEMKYLGHLDMMRLWHRILRILQVPIQYSKGFNPQPLIDGGWALPLGIESHCELLAFFATPFDLSSFVEQFKKLSLNGLNLVHIALTSYTESVVNFAKVFEFTMKTPASFDNAMEVVVKRKGEEKHFNIKDQIKEVVISDQGARFIMELKEGGLKPIEFASFLAKREVSPFELVKTKVFLTGGEVFGT